MNTKHLMTAATLIALVAPAIAADKMSKAGFPAGAYCQVLAEAPLDESDKWMHFTRGKCAPDAELVTFTLKPNGDFILDGLGDPTECKVKSKSYFKGWADYDCKRYGAKVMSSKRYLKLLTHGPGTLDFSGL